MIGETKKDFVTVNGVRLYVEQCGRGEPLLLIPGLGAGAWLWHKSIAALSQHFHLIMPELRGSGRSDKPDQRYSIAMFADDIVKLLEVSGIQRTHILGTSLGGFVAQQLASAHPGMAISLVLVGTTIGGDVQVDMSGDMLSRIIRPRGRSRHERLQDTFHFGFSEAYLQNHQPEVDQITKWRFEFPQPEVAYYRQLMAGYAFDGSPGAPAIKAPTLICMAKADPLVPVENGEILQQYIPNSQLKIFEGKHLFFLEHFEQFNATVIRFLKK